MNLNGSQGRGTFSRGAVVIVAAWAVALIASGASADARFVYAGEQVHPGCIHALVMHQGDRTPVTTAVSLAGCAASERSKAQARYEGDLLTIEDEALLRGGSFGYRVLNRLENGIFGLAIRRVRANGEERVSLAAVQLVPRAMIRNDAIVNLMLVELLGEIWIPDMQLSTFRSMGNIVHFVSGSGPEKVERNIDLTRIGRQRK